MSFNFQYTPYQIVAQYTHHWAKDWASSSLIHTKETRLTFTNIGYLREQLKDIAQLSSVFQVRTFVFASNQIQIRSK